MGLLCRRFGFVGLLFKIFSGFMGMIFGTKLFKGILLTLSPELWVYFVGDSAL